MKTVGVLALQGGFDPHLRMLKAIGTNAIPVRSLEEIRDCHALVIPGGESTTIGKLLVLRGLLEPLADLLRNGFPVLGTCAGLILLSQKALGQDQPLLKVLDVDVSRNAYGSQTESFETVLNFNNGVQTTEISAIFIRAPQIVRVGPKVKVLASYEGQPVCVQQDNILAASFHSELTENEALHRYFLSLV